MFVFVLILLLAISVFFNYALCSRLKGIEAETNPRKQKTMLAILLEEATRKRLSNPRNKREKKLAEVYLKEDGKR